MVSKEKSNTSNAKCQLHLKQLPAPVAQLDRVGGFEPLGRGFESLRVHQNKQPQPFKLGFLLFMFFRVLVRISVRTALTPTY